MLSLPESIDGNNKPTARSKSSSLSAVFRYESGRYESSLACSKRDSPEALTRRCRLTLLPALLFNTSPLLPPEQDCLGGNSDWKQREISQHRYENCQQVMGFVGVEFHNRTCSKKLKCSTESRRHRHQCRPNEHRADMKLELT